MFDTLHRADINGNLGNLLNDVESLNRQKRVFELMQPIDRFLLRVVFGDNAEVAVYSDGRIENQANDFSWSRTYEL